MSRLLALCMMVASIGALGGLCAVAVAVSARSFGRLTRQALAVAALGAAPGILFVVHSVAGAAVTSRVARAPYDLWTLAPALAWLIVGPLVFVRSFQLARPLAVPWTVDLLRGVLVLGWAAGSCIATVAVILV